MFKNTNQIGVYQSRVDLVSICFSLGVPNLSHVARFQRAALATDVAVGCHGHTHPLQPVVVPKKTG